MCRRNHLYFLDKLVPMVVLEMQKRVLLPLVHHLVPPAGTKSEHQNILMLSTRLNVRVRATTISCASARFCVRV